MSKPSNGTFKIVSLVEGNPPTGIGLILPAFQSVHLNQSLQVWKLKGDAANQTFQFSVGGYPFTGVLDDKVIATVYAEQEVKWHVTYRKAQDAYTIELNEDRSKGWTVSLLEVPDLKINPVIDIQIIKELRSEPPKFSTGQLFRFERVDE